MSDDDYRGLQVALVSRPGLGDLIPGGGGLRKVRWRVAGHGKRGGVRLIYYWAVDDEHIRMLYVYPKGSQANLTQVQIKQLQRIVKRWN